MWLIELHFTEVQWMLVSHIRDKKLRGLSLNSCDILKSMSSPPTEVKVLACGGADKPVSFACRAGWCPGVPPAFPFHPFHPFQTRQGLEAPARSILRAVTSDCTNEQGHLWQAINTHLLDSTVRWLELLQFSAEWEHKEWLSCFHSLAHSPHVPWWAVGAGWIERRWGCSRRDPPVPAMDPALLVHKLTLWALPALLLPTSLWVHISETGFQVPCHMLCSCIFLVLLLFSSD